MKKIPNIKDKLRKLETEARELHKTVFEALKDAVPNDKVRFEAHLRGSFLYSIACGEYSFGYFSHKIFHEDGKIELYSMRFEQPHRQIASWSTVEKFKKEIASHFK